MARRRSSGALAAVAEAQRRQQRQRQAELRAWRAAEAERERAQRAAARARAQGQRQAWQAYQAGRESDAAARTKVVEAQVAELEAVLQKVLASPPFGLDQLFQPVRVAPFNPGQLAVPFVMPTQRAYQVPQLTGMRAFSAAAKREYEEACRRAQAQFEHDWQECWEQEEHRRRQLDTYQREYQAWAERETQRIAANNARVEQLGRSLTAGDADAVGEYFAAALQISGGWPASFPRQAEVAWHPADGTLVVDWELPDFSVVPALSRYRYIKSDDRETQIALPAGERKAIYRRVLAQCALGVLAAEFRADWADRVGSDTVNGYVSSTDPSTGRPGRIFLMTVMVSRSAYARLDLGKVDPVSCLEALRGQLSSRPDALLPVKPVSLASTTAGHQVDDVIPSASDLMRLDPIDFEDLVAALFQAMGMEVMTTARSGDGGVDVRAMDPDPIRGGKLVIQVKRYSNTVPPAPVRDLYGTMLHEGAVKGILVTTAEFGPSAQEFASGKPLTLIGGAQLTDLLARYGITSPADLA